MNNTARVLVATLLCATAVACTKKVKEVPPPAEPVAEPPAPVVETPPAPTGFMPEDLDTDACLRQRVIYFDFDQDVLRPEFQSIVACHAKYLVDRPSSRMTLEGNADERGSREYNQGLGERRANTVSSALQASGGTAGQVTVTSYGEERPTCTESNEECWSKNRRVEIIYTEK